MRQRRASARQADESRKLILKDLLDDDNDVDKEDEVTPATTTTITTEKHTSTQTTQDMILAVPSSPTATESISPVSRRLIRIRLNMSSNGVDDDDNTCCCSPQGSSVVTTAAVVLNRKRKAMTNERDDDDDYQDDNNNNNEDDEEEEEEEDEEIDDEDGEDDGKDITGSAVNDISPASKRQRISSLQVLESLSRIKQKIKDKFEVPLSVIHVSDTVGNGVVAQERIPKGYFVCEYSGQLISNSEAKKREKIYAQAGKGCFMFYFNHNSRVMCIDATEEHFCSAGGHGRLINHRIEPNSNLFPKKIVVDGKPHIAYIAARDIEKGEEISFDYGDRRKETVEAFPWLLQ